MAQSGYTPILIYASGTATNVPSAANLTSSASGAELALNYADGKLYYKNSAGVVTLLASTAGASGDVVGPASSTDNALARFDSTTGKLIQNSVGILSDAGILTGLTGITSSGSITFSSLTSGRVPYATTAGLLTDSANLLYSGTDLTVYGLTVGRGASAVANNTAVGASALAANTTGFQNTAIGSQALNVNTTGTLNAAFGDGTLQSATTADGNTAVGSGAQLFTTTGAGNVSVGRIALFYNTTGANNVAVGKESLFQNTTASSNTAVGYQSLYSYTNGTGGTVAVGYQAGYTSNAAYGTFIGQTAGYSATGANATHVGFQAGYYTSSGTNNTSLGWSALQGSAGATGASNTAIGSQALFSNTTASNNTAVGYQAGYSSTGASNTAFGANALTNCTTASETVAIGQNAIGNGVLTGVQNTGIGVAVMYPTTTGTLNFGGGYTALRFNTTGSYNTAVGATALYSNTTASNNTAVGYEALYTNTGGNCTAIGYQALKANTTGGSDAFGFQALTANTTGVSNNAFGLLSLATNTTGSYNTAFGQQSLINNTTASNNTAVGYQAGYSNTTGTRNALLGYVAGYSLTGNYCTLIGAGAGYSTTGERNTFVGDYAGNLVTTGTKNTIIGKYDGNQGGLDIRTASNYIVLSDGDGNPRGIFDGSGNFLIGLTVAAAGSASTVYKNLDSTWTWRVEAGATSLPNGILVKYSGASPNDTGNQFLYCEDSGNTQRMSVRSNGGIANYSANDANLSDRREKTNFAPAGSYLDKICAIPVQTFNYIDQNLEEDGGLTLGVVAQDVQAVAPELVMESNWASKDEAPKMRLSIYQTDLQYALMKCIQEQQAIIESLKARLDAANL
jgi:hypothetical protein